MSYWDLPIVSSKSMRDRGEIQSGGSDEQNIQCDRIMITIIIPVYNCARFLDQCILSVVEQSYKDWECLLVDDGSTDDSGAICEKWSGLDNRILVCHQKKRGDDNDPDEKTLVTISALDITMIELYMYFDR